MQFVLLRSLHQLRRLASELRDDARRATMSGYAPKMIRAATDLEGRAAELEGLAVTRDASWQREGMSKL